MKSSKPSGKEGRYTPCPISVNTTITTVNAKTGVDLPKQNTVSKTSESESSFD